MSHPDDLAAAPGLGTSLMPQAGETLGASSVRRILGGRYEGRGVLRCGGIGDVRSSRGRERRESPQARSRHRATRVGGISC